MANESPQETTPLNPIVVQEFLALAGLLRKDNHLAALLLLRSQGPSSVSTVSRVIQEDQSRASHILSDLAAGGLAEKGESMQSPYSYRPSALLERILESVEQGKIDFPDDAR